MRFSTARLFIIPLLYIVAVGCASSTRLKFSDVSSNLPLPENLKHRTLWKDTAILQYKLDELSGQILERSAPDQPWIRKQQILSSGAAAPSVNPIVNGIFYHSVVDSSIAGNVGAQVPIVSVAASLKDSQRLELTITDTAICFISDHDVPYSLLDSYARQHPPSPGVRRVWVQAVMLTYLLSNAANKIEANASVSGLVYQVGGSLFNSNSQIQREPFITMLLIDLDALGRAMKNPQWTTPGGGVFNPQAEVLPGIRYVHVETMKIM